MERRGKFDYILLETSGLADPGNIAPLFWVDDGLGSSIYLDGIVTLVDAKNIVQSLDEDSIAETEVKSASDHDKVSHLTTAHLQISHADVILLNKIDTISSERLGSVERRVRSINSLAKIHTTRYSQLSVLEDIVLDMNAYSGVASLDAIGTEQSHLDPVRRPSFSTR